MQIQERESKLKVGNIVIGLRREELDMYRERRKVIVPGGDAKKSDENLMADVMWLNGNPGLPALLEFYKHIKESWFL